MRSLMMDYPLTLQAVLRRTKDVFPEKQIVSRNSDNSRSRIRYDDFFQRVLQVINGLQKLGVKPGDRVATLAWNHAQHLELYFAVPCMGAVLHTLNIHQNPAALKAIINHAEDRLIFADTEFLPTLEKIETEINCEKIIALGSEEYAKLTNQKPVKLLPELDENSAAGLCYTSGSTAEPKGVLYSHRALTLHSLALCLADSMAIAERETVLPVVPMYHANSWGIPYACALAGATLVLPGSNRTAKNLADLIAKEKVTLAAAVPTVWNMLYIHLKRAKRKLPSLKKIIAGGAAVSPALIENFERDFGIQVVHSWGMTELSPVGTIATLRSSLEKLPKKEQTYYKSKQGLPLPFVETKLVGEKGKQLLHDGKSVGELQVRGPWVTAEYFKSKKKTKKSDWLATGDMATIDEYGYVKIIDRKKDLIKTRGEWIASVELEAAARELNGVSEAAAVARKDELRGEAPVLFIVLEVNKKISAQEIQQHLKKQFKRWQLPKISDIKILESLPKIGTGKIDKIAMRKQC